ncbi:hypothetical protein RSAG8_09917, partial [Rhizoctonia solani AG-8 WAC10335]
MAAQIRKAEKEKVCVIGSGNWGSAIARIAAINTKENPDMFVEDVTVYVYEEQFQGRPLSALINETHENPKYLPGIQLGQNVVAEPDLLKAIDGATALVFVLPHQFLPAVLKAMRGHISHLTRAVSLIKGIEVEGAKISTFPTVISSVLGIPCSALSGANIANEVAEDKFCESTLGVPPAPMTTPPDEDAQLHAFSESHLWHLTPLAPFVPNRHFPDPRSSGCRGRLSLRWLEERHCTRCRVLRRTWVGIEFQSCDHAHWAVGAQRLLSGVLPFYASIDFSRGELWSS